MSVDLSPEFLASWEQTREQLKRALEKAPLEPSDFEFVREAVVEGQSALRLYLEDEIGADACIRCVDTMADGFRRAQRSSDKIFVSAGVVLTTAFALDDAAELASERGHNLLSSTINDAAHAARWLVVELLLRGGDDLSK